MPVRLRAGGVVSVNAAIDEGIGLFSGLPRLEGGRNALAQRIWQPLFCINLQTVTLAKCKQAPKSKVRPPPVNQLPDSWSRRERQ